MSSQNNNGFCEKEPPTRGFTPKHTLYACYLAYVTGALINTFPSLLFLAFHNHFGLSLERIALLVSINFGVQILVDSLAARYVDRIGYRACMVGAHLLWALGLAALAGLPWIMSPFWGLAIAVGVNAVAGGLIEVVISPIIESLPAASKSGAMSLLHSFYCWGLVAVVLLSTGFFAVAGVDNWPWLAGLWIIPPLVNAWLFSRVPLARTLVEGRERLAVKTLLASRIFWLMFLLMVCAGASEQAMIQWASLFAEAGLGVGKTTGDLLGPCLFALLMGLSRLAYGLRLGGLKLETALLLGGGLCVGSYLLAVFAPWPLLSLAGCGLCGLSVGIMWPGVLSLSAKRYPKGGTMMFAVLALAGDLGCAAGPGLVGVVSETATRAGQVAGAVAASLSDALKTGLLAAAVFPLLLLAGIFRLRRE